MIPRTHSPTAFPRPRLGTSCLQHAPGAPTARKGSARALRAGRTVPGGRRDAQAQQGAVGRAQPGQWARGGVGSGAGPARGGYVRGGAGLGARWPRRRCSPCDVVIVRRHCRWAWGSREGKQAEEGEAVEVEAEAEREAAAAGGARPRAVGSLD